LAVAEFLSGGLTPLRITFANAGKPLETRLVSAAGYEQVTIPSRPMPQSAREAIGFLTTSFSGYRAASKFLQTERVSLVVGLGGYASVSMARAAARRNIPLVLLEQNSIPGRATRWLASSAAAVCVAFDEVAEQLADPTNVRLTGNPVRRPFAKATVDLTTRFDRTTDRVRQLLVIGGSGGSRTLNEQVPRALYKARGAMQGWQIVHQTGDRNAAAVRELYHRFGMNAVVSTFFDDVPRLLSETDLAISRAGGTSLAELATMGVPSILVPYEKSTDNHQRANADVFQAIGGAVVIDPRDVTSRLDDRLAESVSHLVRHTELRRRMAEAMREQARPKAARAVARTIREVLRSRQLARVA
jgi:UDP-N-acetylglucosamine--N-acetylmuramyl-(pentapeptide) pyrophosphoryl-undecaprenol N-acetylglucosamine transferase